VWAESPFSQLHSPTFWLPSPQRGGAEEKDLFPAEKSDHYEKKDEGPPWSGKKGKSVGFSAAWANTSTVPEEDREIPPLFQGINTLPGTAFLKCPPDLSPDSKSKKNWDRTVCT